MDVLYLPTDNCCLLRFSGAADEQASRQAGKQASRQAGKQAACLPARKPPPSASSGSSTASSRINLAVSVSLIFFFHSRGFHVDTPPLYAALVTIFPWST